MLARTLINQFGKNLFEKAREVVALDGVKVSAFRRGEVGFAAGTMVSESAVAITRVDWNRAGVHAECNCRDFASGRTCLHVAATLLEAERQRLLPAFLLGEALPAKKTRAWAVQLQQIAQEPPEPDRPALASGGRLVYLLSELPATSDQWGVSVRICRQEKDAAGEWGKPRPAELAPVDVEQLDDPADRAILTLLEGASNMDEYGGYEVRKEGRAVYAPALRVVMPVICRTGRALWRGEEDQLGAVRWFEQEYGLVLAVNADAQVTAHLERGTAQVAMAEVRFVAGAELVLQGASLSANGGATLGAMQRPVNRRLLEFVQENCPLQVAEGELDELINWLSRIPGAVRLEIAAELGVRQIQCPCAPRLECHLITARSQWITQDTVAADLEFVYGDTAVPARDAGVAFFDAERRTIVQRDPTAESAARKRLGELGFKLRFIDADHRKLLLSAEGFRGAGLDLALDGWQIEGTGIARYVPASDIELRVSSGIDWLDLTGSVQFGEQAVALPALLAAMRKGERFVALPNSRRGLMPQKLIGALAALATKVEGDAVRFRPSQAALLDALVSGVPKVQADARFSSLRLALRESETMVPIEAPAGFIGQLRDYQKLALGWFAYLRRYNLGGCLADDMGLGKTVQVLAMLEDRRRQRDAGSGVGAGAGAGAGGMSGSGADAPVGGPVGSVGHRGDQGVGTTLGVNVANPEMSGMPGPADGPRVSLVVAPRSLVFNWKQEAAKFTPLLKVLDYTGGRRDEQKLEDYDLVLTTYGTLRRDAAQLTRTAFDYVVLDEAQAIKNASTATAKSVRVLDARNRLALSGTPVENHLGELVSLFDFLNPGMLGDKLLTSGRLMEQDAAGLLGRALRPFILRRTKAQVAPELPERTEQTIYCELDAPQRKEYDQLRAHYQKTLLGDVQKKGIAQSRMQVLEALLRLRQAACHPGLMDPARGQENSAKLEALLGEIEEVIEAGHKALIFSQFVRLLKIVRSRLDEKGVVYEYLDGATADRQKCVTRFQEDADCPLFLISLKAGGVGLNLTAAEYVFLLDPWWNPAVEAQAIDRAHRIGQTRRVFAYRLISRDTVEEKVVQLQQKKRDLVDAIMGAEGAVPAAMTQEDLEMLLG